MMKVAYFKGNRSGIAKLFSIICRWWLRGQYSHVELIFKDGVSASSSSMDGGVRFKRIDFDPKKWDIQDIGMHDKEDAARQYIADKVGCKFDYLGMFAHVDKRLKENPNRYFCSEIIAAALGFKEAWRLDPCSLFIAVDFYLKNKK
jgi:hypothetical protein